MRYFWRKLTHQSKHLKKYAILCVGNYKTKIRLKCQYLTTVIIIFK